MKSVTTFLAMIFLLSCASGKETSYTGSTPAGAVVKSFLGIPLTDSADFIRWKISFTENLYQLQCDYGIGKPNTNGFIDGKHVQLTGTLKKENNQYQLHHGNKILKLAILNPDLLHLLNPDNSFLTGNGGWSYTLNNLVPVHTDQFIITTQQTPLKDSMAFEGRSPCGVPGIIPEGKICYKLKWYLVLYGDAVNNKATTYKVYGTGYRKAGGRKGNWVQLTGKDGRIIYQLNDENGKGFIFLLKTAGNILVFTDAQGKLLVGNEDFSYTLNNCSFKTLNY